MDTVSGTAETGEVRYGSNSSWGRRCGYYLPQPCSRPIHPRQIDTARGACYTRKGRRSCVCTGARRACLSAKTERDYGEYEDAFSGDARERRARKPKPKRESSNLAHGVVVRARGHHFDVETTAATEADLTETAPRAACTRWAAGSSSVCNAMASESVR